MTDDKIIIDDLRIRAILGVDEWERERKQDILVSMELHTDTSKPGRSDQVEHAVNYRTVAKRVIRHAEEAERRTVEALAEDIAALCLDVEGVQRVGITVEKPDALRDAATVGVRIQRERNDKEDTKEKK